MTLFARTFVVTMAIAGLAAFALWIDMQTFLDRPISHLDDGVDFVITPGQALTTIARNLKQEQILNHPTYWIAEARRLRVGNRLQAGEYRIEPRQTPRDLLAKFVAGEVQRYTVTLVDGRGYTEYLSVLAAHPKIARTIKDEADTELLAKIGASESFPEGIFFPDTYFFTKGSTDADILRRAYERMRDYLAVEWEQRDEGLPFQTPYDALIMASIVQAETGVSEELAMVAGVYILRLQRAMPLQADPTVIYGIGRGFDGDLRRADLRNDTPYNTYLHPGLPPTPITNPGGAAIQAVLHPQLSGYLYFVAKGDGTHEFSLTYDAHRRAVARYQQ